MQIRDALLSFPTLVRALSIMMVSLTALEMLGEEFHRDPVGRGPFRATKWAQLSMVRNLARQLAEHGVTINNLAPSVIETDRNREVLADASYSQQVLSQIPAECFGQADDCVGAAWLLYSDAGRYITGIDPLVDGGMHLH